MQGALVGYTHLSNVRCIKTTIGEWMDWDTIALKPTTFLSFWCLEFKALFTRWGRKFGMRLDTTKETTQSRFQTRNVFIQVKRLYWETYFTLWENTMKLSYWSQTFVWLLYLRGQVLIWLDFMQLWIILVGPKYFAPLHVAISTILRTHSSILWQNSIIFHYSSGC